MHRDAPLFVLTLSFFGRVVERSEKPESIYRRGRPVCLPKWTSHGCVRWCVKYTNTLFYCYFYTVSCHFSDKVLNNSSERSEESDNVCFIFLLTSTDFSLCSTTRLHFVQNDRDHRYFDTPPYSLRYRILQVT